MEVLVDLLTRVVERPLGVAEPEVVVVQSLGMERWVSMELARRLGVWANPDFPFPRKFLERVMASVLGKEEEGWRAFMPERLAWSVAAILPGLLAGSTFAGLAGYLGDDERLLKRIQLAHRIAHVFDGYSVFRPEMVLEWESGGGEGWQPELWRALVGRLGPVHLAARARLFIEALRGGRVGGLPARASLFGISSLPPLYLEVLAEMSRSMEIDLFLLSPTRGSGGDHPLLASMGRQARELGEVLAGLEVEDEDRHVDPGKGSLLAALQSDILAGKASGAALEADDRSIGVHSCHGPMREIEVLHDRLLAMLDEDPGLEPRDVIVMTPDMEAYAPFIDAVFGGEGRIPYRIADRPATAGSEVAAAFLAIVDAARGRLPASEVVDVLAMEPVRARYGLDDMETVRRWVDETGIRWGADTAHRREQGLAFEENTWRFGLDRLLAGFALGGGEPWCGTLPYDDVEGAGTLGGLVGFSEDLLGLKGRLEGRRTVGQWVSVLEPVLSMIEVTRTSAWQHRGIRNVLTGLAGDASGFDEQVCLDVVRSEVGRVLEAERSAHDFLSAGVTFCEMLPMRSIPSQVVCLVGMSDEAFPRTRRSPSFDLVAESRRPGDRSSREDDRHVFLETLLSARKRLLVTYVGRSIQDLSSIPPSVVVSELLDVVGAGVVTHHPMQPFSPRYFDGRDPGLFSYSVKSCEAARILTAGRHEQPPFITAPVPLAGDEAADAIELDELVRFFMHPCRAFLRTRLGLYLGDEVLVLEDREPALLDGLGSYVLGSALLERALAGERIGEAYGTFRASGSLPPGAPGSCTFEDHVPEVQSMAEAIRAHASGDRLDPLEVDLDLDGLALHGWLRDLWPSGLVMGEFGRLKARRKIALWIRHMALCAAGPGRCPARSVLVARGEEIALEPVQDAREHLARLAELYRAGREIALPFFPESSLAYAKALARHGQEDRALESARRAFEPDERREGSGERDVHIETALKGHDPLEVDLGGIGFASLATLVWGPWIGILGSRA
jgi:exodeoxyribonuclease V gamma subunit